MKADLFFIILKFTGQSSWTGFFHVVDSHEKGVFPRLIAVSEVCVPKSMLKGASVIYKIADLLHGLIAYHVLHAAGIFFCNAAFYSYIFQKLGEGFMAMAAFLAPDPSQLCEADADDFFFDFYVALGGQLFQTGQNLPSAHLHPPANLGDSDQGVLFCKRAKLLQYVFLDFSFG